MFHEHVSLICALIVRNTLVITSRRTQGCHCWRVVPAAVEGPIYPLVAAISNIGRQWTPASEEGNLALLNRIRAVHGVEELGRCRLVER
jgi:hypothetical protein